MERVTRHLEMEFFSGSQPPGARLTPVRTLADQLGVSSAVVHAVYRRLQKEGKIVSTVGRGTFLSPEFEPKGLPTAGRICLAVSAPAYAPLHSEWGSAIVSALLKASTTGTRRVSILPFTTEVHSPDAIPRLLIEEVGEVDGLISFNIPDRTWNQRVLDVYAAAGKPVIGINAYSCSHTANFVSANYYESGLAIGQGLMKAGRRRFLFLGAVPLAYSPSSIQRISGLHTALADNPEVEPLRIVQAGRISEEAGYETMRRLLRQGIRPDAIYASGDFLALAAVKALREFNIKVPEEVSVIGGTGLKASRDHISTVTNPYEKLGEAAIAMALACIANRGKPVPGVYLPMGFAAGGTTRSVEDELLS